METPEKLTDLFHRFLRDEISRAELQLLFEHFKLDNDQEQLRRLIARELASDASYSKKERVQLGKIADRVEARLDERLLETRQHIDGGSRRRWLRYAAAAAVVVLGGVGWLYRAGLREWIDPAQTLTVTIPYGETKQVKLPDGSQVYLNAGTSFSYPERFSGDQRQVTLQNGEAYFEVTRNPKQPFTIEARGLRVKVLGTAFNVKAYQDDPITQVSVSSGKVEVSEGKSPPLTLSPSQQVKWDKSRGQLLRSEISEDDIAAWRDKRMVFDNETLRDVFRTLERHYNIDIKAQNPEILKGRVTFRFQQQPLEEVLDILSFTKNFKYEKTNDTTFLVR